MLPGRRRWIVSGKNIESSEEFAAQQDASFAYSNNAEKRPSSSICMRTLLASYCLVVATYAHSACQLSTEPHPNGVVGLQLFYPDDPRSWQWADELNVPWLRIELRWDWIEPYQGRFDAAYSDRVMALASAHRQKLMVLFNHVPAWARDPDRLPGHTAAAIRWLVTRYGRRVQAWEIINEPNLPGYGWFRMESQQKSATVYARTLAAASNAIRELDKKAIVVSGGLSPQADPETYAIWIVRLTPLACFDALGLHPYGQQGRFAAVKKNADTLLAQEHTLPKPIWFTEYGTDQDSQRPEIIEALKREKSAVPITFFFAERDFGGWFTESYGLRTKGGEPKAGYNAFKLLNGP